MREVSSNARRPWLWYALAAVLVLADQVVKYLVRTNMVVGESRPFIPLVELFYVKNTGAAFSLFSGHTWILAALSAAVTLGLVVTLWTGWLGDSWFLRLCLTLVLGGAAGNLIDRALLGEVTDMFNFTFIRFGVFNVADIWVVVGVILLAIWLIWGPKEDNHGSASPQS